MRSNKKLDYKIKIPSQLCDVPGARFIKIDKHVGGGKKPAEKGWNKDKNYPWQTGKLLGHMVSGGNYGLQPVLVICVVLMPTFLSDYKSLVL